MIRALFNLPRFAMIPTCVLATAALAAFTYPGGLHTAYDDVEQYGQRRQELSSAPGENARIDATIANISDRIAMKELWIDELIAGRATLQETTQRFSELNSSNEAVYADIDWKYTGATYEEKAARNVIDFVKTRLRVAGAPSNAAQNIQNQFRKLFGTTIDIS